MNCVVKSEASDLDSNNSNVHLKSYICVKFNEATVKSEPSDLDNQSDMLLPHDINMCHNENMIQTEYFITEPNIRHKNHCKAVHKDNSLSGNANMIKLEPPSEHFHLETHRINEISDFNCSTKFEKLDSVTSDFQEINYDTILNYQENCINLSSLRSNTRIVQSSSFNSHHNKPHEKPPYTRYNIKSQLLSPNESVNKLCGKKTDPSYKNCEKDNAESFVINVDPARVGNPESSDKNSVPVSGAGNVFHCKKCDRSFPLEQLLNLHERNHARERNFMCAQCDKSFFSKSDLHHHIAVHMDKKPFACTLCSKAFRRKTLLRKHELFHGGKQKMLSCTICTKLFISEAELAEHLKVHKKSKQFICNICKCSFVTKHTLRRHEHRRHNKDSKFSCDYCREMFSSSAKLARHVVTHAGSRPFTCKICTKSFILSHHLSQHMGIHAPEKMFTCHHCARSYTRRDSLHVHMRIHAAVRPYGCSYCFKTFSTNGQLTRHLRVHMGQQFKCSVCTKTFVTNIQLQRHFKYHESKLEK